MNLRSCRSHILDKSMNNLNFVYFHTGFLRQESIYCGPTFHICHIEQPCDFLRQSSCKDQSALQSEHSPGSFSYIHTCIIFISLISSQMIHEEHAEIQYMRKIGKFFFAGISTCRMKVLFAVIACNKFVVALQYFCTDDTETWDRGSFQCIQPG